MKKCFFVSLIFVSIILSKAIFAQDSYSIQLNGGIVIPMSSSNGLISSVQVNYSLNPNIQFYIYSGYSAWDRYNVVYHEEYSAVQKKQLFNSYSADNHILIPVYIGSRINFHTNKIFTSYLNIEMGYSHLSYNNYKNLREVDSGTGEILSYYVDQSSKKEISSINKEFEFNFVL
jgi:hypothetical protein